MWRNLCLHIALSLSLSLSLFPFSLLIEMLISLLIMSSIFLSPFFLYVCLSMYGAQSPNALQTHMILLLLLLLFYISFCSLNQPSETIRAMDKSYVYRRVIERDKKQMWYFWMLDQISIAKSVCLFARRNSSQAIIVYYHHHYQRQNNHTGKKHSAWCEKLKLKEPKRRKE